MMQSRIAVISFDFYPFHPRVRCLSEAAVDAGYTVDVICLLQPNAKRFEVYNGVNVYRVPVKRHWDSPLFTTIFKWCWFLILAGTLLTWLHLKRPYNIIHVHNMPDFLVLSALFPKLLKAKVILDIQDASPELMVEKAKGRLRKLTKLLALWQERISTAFANHVITIGWTLEELLLQRGVPKEKLTSILNSADPKFFPPS
ncbi:MAG: glycosyltransferase, partial [Ktedonobacteraceae bacterium]